MVKDKLGVAAASAPKGDPPGKYTLNGWGQTEADLAFFDLAQDKVELKSDGWRTEKIADHPNVYEWWYFDIHNHDGTIVTGMLSPQTAVGRVPRFGAPRAMSRIDVNRNKVQSIALETFPIDQFTSATDSCDVRSGGLTMRGDFAELQIRGKVKDNEIDVVFRQTATPLRPGNGYVFLGSTDTFQGWFNAFPSATATGHVIIGGRRSRSMVSDTMITTTATYRSARDTGAGSGRDPRSSDTRPSPSNARTVRDSEGGRCRCCGSTTKRRRRSSCAPRPWMT